MKTINTAFKALSKNELSKIVGGETIPRCKPNLTAPDPVMLPSGGTGSIPTPTPTGGTSGGTSSGGGMSMSCGDEAGTPKSVI